MFSASFLATLIFAVTVGSKPVLIDKPLVTLPISRYFNISSSHKILQRDQARAAALKGRYIPSTEKRAVVSSPATNVAVVYTAAVGIGSPATSYDLLIDTGSSNTWVGAGIPYVQTSTSSSTGQSVSVTYGSGSFSGTEFIDQVTIASGLVIPRQSIGVASTSEGFTGFDGILGIGPVVLTEGTLNGGSSTLIPTVTDNLFSSGIISQNLVSVSFNPTTSLSVTNGELTWGGTDSTKFTGNITFIPKTTTQPASFFWGINQSITYGTGNTAILSTTAGIVDTGTTLILISSDAFTRYMRATGAVNDNATGLLRLTTAQFANLQSLNFNMGSTTFTLTPNGQIWPRALNTAIGGSASSVYLIVNSLGTPTGEGFDFVNGYSWLERFYSVYDTANNRVGFALTPNTNSNSN